MITRNISTSTPTICFFRVQFFFLHVAFFFLRRQYFWHKIDSIFHCGHCTHKHQLSA
uniref:Uncharacterized protein n=1 Tax=Anguilla anguilla TaxID=7936 RepID=A0A0E9RWP2_ANGAN